MTKTTEPDTGGSGSVAASDRAVVALMGIARPLSNAGVRVVLAGTGTHPTGADLPDVPAIAATLDDLASAFVRRCGVAPENLTVVADPATPLALGDALSRAAAAATEVLVFYYVGHGLVGESGGELHLATSATDELSVGLAYKALPYSAVRDALTGCRAPLLVVVLDCCFSGRAGNSFALGTLRAAELTGVHGSYLLTSAARDELALAPHGARHTTFSGALIELLTEGDPIGPTDITLDHAYQYLARVLRDRDAPRPHRQAGDRGGDLVLAPNPAAGVAPTGDNGSVVPPSEPVCPYRGMRRYDREDARWYFGRDAMTAELLRRVTGKLAASGMVVVVGPSGSGKSSLLRAGLLPALAEDDTVGAPSWPQLVFTPGAQPMTTLSRKLDGRPAAADEVLASLRAACPDAARVVLVVDQFEELFTACQDETERRAFLRSLTALAGPGPDGAEPAAVVVLGVRADFYQHCLRYPELARAMADGQVPVVPMTAAELREVVERPAALAGLTVEPALVDLLRHDLDTGPDGDVTSALPLLSYALVETWQKRAGTTLTVTGYQATTGVWQAVRRRADEVYEGLDAAARPAARRLLLRMIRLGDGTSDTLRPLDVTTLRGQPDDPTDEALRAFADAGLITVDATTARITHEALLRAWPLLRGWLADDRQELLARQQLQDAAHTWRQEGRDPAGLYRGGRLAAVRDWRDRPELTEIEREFLAASTAEDRRVVRRRRIVTGALAVLTVLALVATGIAVTSARNAVAQQRTSLSEALSSESTNEVDTNMRKANMLAMAAWQTAHNAASLSGLLSSEGVGYLGSFTGGTAFVTSMAVSPDNSLLAVGDQNGAVHVWTLRTRRLLHTFALHHQVGALAFSPDGTTLTAGVLAAHGLSQWDVATFRPLPDFYPSIIGVTALAYSSDGRTLAVAGLEGTKQTVHFGTVRLWDTVGHRSTGSFLASTSAIQVLAYSPNGRMIATAGSDDTARLWNAATTALTAVFTGHTATVNTLAFAPDGATLATGSLDGTARVWNVATGSSRVAVTDNVGVAPAVRFSPSGDTLLATDQGNIASYDLSAGVLGIFPDSLQTPFDQLVFSPDGHTLVAGGTQGAVAALSWHRRSITTGTSPLAVAISPDGRTVAVGENDGSVDLWPVANPADQRRLVGRQGSVQTLAFDRDGSHLAMGGLSGGVEVWAVATGRRLTVLPPGAVANTDEVSYSPDGRTLVTSSFGGNVDFWDAATFRHLGALPPQGLGGPQIAFSPDGRMLATAKDAKVQLWNPGTRKLITAFTAGPAGSNIPDIAFSPKGDLLAIPVDSPISQTQKVRFWNVADRKVIGEIDDIPTLVTEVAFSPDGATMAIVGQESSVSLWRVADRTPLATLNVASPGLPVHSVAFSPVGSTLVVSAADFTVTYWNLDPNVQFAQLCQTLSAPTFDAEWSTLDPNIGPPPACVR